jgi:surfactin synthase thioesterase subunit
LPVQLPGRENRIAEAPFVAWRPLVRSLAEALAPRLPSPYAFFGHSMGALLAFELTRELRRLRAPSPLALAVSAHRAPHLESRHPMLHLLPEPMFVREIDALEGTPSAVLQNPELRALLVPTLRADFAVCETYIHDVEAPLECPLMAIGGQGDPLVTSDELDAWRRHTRGQFTRQRLPGGHLFLHPERSTLMVLLRDWLHSIVTPSNAAVSRFR